MNALMPAPVMSTAGGGGCAATTAGASRAKTATSDLGTASPLLLGVLVRWHDTRNGEEYSCTALQIGRGRRSLHGVCTKHVRRPDPESAFLLHASAAKGGVVSDPACRVHQAGKLRDWKGFDHNCVLSGGRTSVRKMASAPPWLLPDPANRAQEGQVLYPRVSGTLIGRKRDGGGTNYAEVAAETSCACAGLHQRQAYRGR